MTIQIPNRAGYKQPLKYLPHWSDIPDKFKDSESMEFRIISELLNKEPMVIDGETLKVGSHTIKAKPGVQMVPAMSFLLECLKAPTTFPIIVQCLCSYVLTEWFILK